MKKGDKILIKAKVIRTQGDLIIIGVGRKIEFACFRTSKYIYKIIK